MSCLDNTDILRIVGGNSFQIAITVKARRVADGSEIEDFDLSASSPVLNLIHAGEKTRKYFVTQGNQAIISFDGSEGLGYYGMEMSGSYNSEAWRFCIEKVLQLVDTNAKANIPEWSFLVDDTYFIEGTISIYGGGGGGDTVQADWTETNPTSAAFILHKPDLSVYATKTEVASGLEGKQDTIVDLTSIRSGAAAGATAYQKPTSGIPESDMSDGVQTSLDKADSAYQLPANGIPSSDMDSEVQAALEKANSAVQTETDPVFSNSPAAEISQADINNWNAKQPAIADLADIREGAAAGATAVQSDEMAQAIDEVDGDIADINAKIPSTASSLNQLADKAYVNSSIATNSATYRGSFNLITDLGMNVDATHAQIAGALATAITTADNNDYAFVQIPDSASTPTVIAKIERYKHNGSGWVYEYDLNNSGFTSAQWAAINSGITSGLVGKLADLPNNSELATLLNGKQNVINDLSAIRSGAAAGATAIQPADLTEALNGVEAEIAGLDESKQDVIEDLSTIRSGAAAGATAYQKPASGIPESDMSDGVQTSLDKADSAYQKPSSGIPSTDMDAEVRAALDKANSAVQTETDPVFSNSPAAEITQADINNWNAKQPAIADLADIREGAAAGATAVQPDEMAQAIDEVDGDIEDINAKIPTAASNLNQLADKAYVNSSIATNSATYRGSFNLITDLGMNVDATHAQIAGALATAIVTADNNDYAFVQIPDSASTPTVIAKIERYKHNGSGWVYEYDLNNSGFTAAQWAAINSGITSGLVGKLADLPNNSELATLLNGKQNVINDLSAIRSGAAAGATAVQPADLTEALNDVEAEIAGLDESKQDTIEDLSTIRSGAAAGATAYQKPVTGIPESDMSDGVQSALDKAEDAYQLPANGIPASDMDADVQASLEKANSAVQTETDPVFSGSPAAEITQADINNWNAKQSAIADLADIREGAAAGATAVQPDEMAQAIDGVEGDIDAINAKIPTAASNLNQLADKAYVNSSIATNSATYRGSFNLITDLGMNVDATHAQIAGALATSIVTADNNDYAFVQIPDSASTPTVIAKIERYKHNGTGWVYEYDLNNSGFTAAQWAAINSGITSGLVGKLADLPNNSELATLLNGKQNVINDLATIRSGASAGATAYQKPSGGIPASDMSSTVQQELSKANTAVQTETDPIFSASPAANITAQNIQTWNGEPAARQAADTVLQNSVSTLQTDLAAEATARTTADALLQQQYNALTQSDIIVGALPATGVPNVIYRVPGTTDFTDYMWYDNQFVPMATYGLPISAEFVVDENLNKTQEEINQEMQSGLDVLVVTSGDIDKLLSSGTLDTNQGVGNVANLYHRDNANFKSAIINVSQGDIFYIQGSGSNYGYCYAILNSSQVILAASKNLINGDNITIPENGLTLVVNFNITLDYSMYMKTTRNNQIDENTRNIAQLQTSVNDIVTGQTHINRINPANAVLSKVIDNIAVGSEQTFSDNVSNDVVILDSANGDVKQGTYYTFKGVTSYSVIKSDNVVYTKKASTTASSTYSIAVPSIEGIKVCLQIGKTRLGVSAMFIEGNNITMPDRFIPYDEIELNYKGENVAEHIKIPGNSILDGTVVESKYGDNSIPTRAIPDATVQDLKWDNILWGKKLVVCGDSFTYGTGAGRIPASGIYGGKGAQQIANYARFIALRNNMTLYNEAIGGSTMAMPLEWIEDETAVLDDNDLLHIFSYKRYLNENFNDADYILINFGINDTAPNGKLDDTDATFLSDAYDGSDGVDIAQVTHSDFDFYGAFNKTVRSILTRNPRVKIGIIIAERGATLKQRAIINTAIRWGIPYIYQSGNPHVSLIGVGNMIQATYHGRLNTSYWYEVKFVNKEEYTNSQYSVWDSEQTYSINDIVKYTYFDVSTGKNEYVIIQSLINNNDKKPIVTMSDEAYEIRNRVFDSKYGTQEPDDPTSEGSPYHPNYYGQLYLSTVYENFLRSL